MSWNLYQNAGTRAFAKQFKIEMLHTNGVTGVGIFELKTGQPLWAEWDFNNDGKPDQENYFFRGKDVFDITLISNRPPIYSVYFRGPGKRVTWWTDRGGTGSFTERIFYDKNGSFFRQQVWWNQAWHAVDRRNKKNGIVIDGMWREIAIDTNGMWAIDTTTNAPGQ